MEQQTAAQEPQNQTATRQLTATSSSGSHTRKPKDSSVFSAKDLASLQRFLDHDFQNFWDIRRCGNNVGLIIACPVCGDVPPPQQANEDWVWYGYRKWRWTAEHIVSKHCKQMALTFRRIRAQEKRIQDKAKSKKAA